MTTDSNTYLPVPRKHAACRLYTYRGAVCARPRAPRRSRPRLTCLAARLPRPDTTMPRTGVYYGGAGGTEPRTELAVGTSMRPMVAACERRGGSDAFTWHRQPDTAQIHAFGSFVWPAEHNTRSSSTSRASVVAPIATIVIAAMASAPTEE